MRNPLTENEKEWLVRWN